VFLSDVPSDVTTHGSFFVMAHFHYTIMGGLIFTFFAAIYYWVPKMYGYKFNETLGKIHFWVMFIAFNSTFGPLFGLGFMGMPRRVVTYPAYFQSLNDWVSISAYVLGLSMLVFFANVIWSLVIKREPAEANPWRSKSIEFQLPTPVPLHDFNRIPTFGPDPYPYGVDQPAPVPAVAPAGGATLPAGGGS
jgi:cytochrome c oxidase subunit 1